MSAERVAYLRRMIEGITAELKGSMSNLERQLLVADRKDARAELAKLEAQQGEGAKS